MVNKKSRFYSRHIIEKTLMHHLIEWVATGLSIGGAILNSSKHISGFYMWSVANVLWMSFAWKHKHWGLFVMNLIFLCINVYGVVIWSKGF